MDKIEKTPKVKKPNKPMYMVHVHTNAEGDVEEAFSESFSPVIFKKRERALVVAKELCAHMGFELYMDDAIPPAQTHQWVTIEEFKVEG